MSTPPMPDDAPAGFSPVHDADAPTSSASAGFLLFAGDRRRRRWLGVITAGTFVVACVAGYAVGAWRTHRMVEARTPAATIDVVANDPADDGLGGGSYVFRSGDMSTAAGVGAVWAYDAAGARTPDAARALARALHVVGEFEDVGGAFTVAAEDGSFLTLYADEEATFDYANPANDPELVCADEDMSGADGSGAGADESGAGADGSGAGGSGLGGCASAPSDQEAIAAAREVIAGLGIAGLGGEGLGGDAPAMDFVVDDDLSGDGTTWVDAFVVVDGRRSEPSWSAGVSAEGVRTLTGTAAPLIALGDYALISPAEAVDRLNDRRFAPLEVDWVEPYDADQDLSPAASSARAGGAISWPAVDVLIVGAELTSATLRAGGTAVIVPAYVLRDDRGNGFTVIAVADEALTFGG